MKKQKKVKFITIESCFLCPQTVLVKKIFSDKVMCGYKREFVDNSPNNQTIPDNCPLNEMTTVIEYSINDRIMRNGFKKE